MTLMNLQKIEGQLHKEWVRLTKQAERIEAAMYALASVRYGKKTKSKRHISAAGRARIAAAQRARWAKVKGKK